MKDTVKLASYEQCTGCMICQDVCPANAIQSTLKGYLSFPCINPQKCLSCKMCQQFCPVHNPVSRLTPSQLEGKAFAAWASDMNFRLKSASGGVFAVIANYVIQEKHGIVCGVACIKNETKHIFISDVKDIHLLQGSKYQQSDISGIYKQCAQYINQGRYLLFSGTPCQCAGLKKYLSQFAVSDNYLIVSLICSGVPSKQSMSIFRRKYPNYVDIESFRNKNNGWAAEGYPYEVTVKDSNGNIINLGENNILSAGFSSGVFLRPSCRDCPIDVLSISTADIVIGDYWRTVEFSKESAGVSAIYCNRLNSNVLDALNHSGLQLHKTSLQDIIRGNPRLITGKNHCNIFTLLLRKWLILMVFGIPDLHRFKIVKYFYEKIFHIVGVFDKIERKFREL